MSRWRCGGNHGSNEVAFPANRDNLDQPSSLDLER